MPLLPSTDLNVSALSLGTAGLGTHTNDRDSGRLLDLYVELGGNFLDSAHCYACWVPQGTGASERAIGNWLRSSGVRDQILLATKGGHPPIEGYSHRDDFLSAESIAQDLAESLDRLDTDRIDLYYLHRDDGVTPVDEIVDALNAQKHVRFFGASNWSIARMADANDYAARTGQRGFIALQSQWSVAIPVWKITDDPTVRYIESSDHAWCADHNIAILAYSSTANGYFAGQEHGAFATPENNERRERVGQVAERLKVTPTQVALAWLLSQRGCIVPLLGTGNPKHLEDALGAAGLTLDDETVAFLRAT